MQASARARAGEPALEIRGLRHRFGPRAVLDGLDLHVEAGDLYGFLGPNGAGKTTTFRLVLGLLPLQEGEVRVFGEDHPVRRLRALGALLERPAFHPRLSARRNLLLAQSWLGGGEPAEVDRLLDRLGLGAVAGRRAAELSHGMRQRLGLARALLGAPRLLLLDEPMQGLDPRGMHEFRELLRGLAAEGTTILLSSHLLSEVESLCNRVAILDGGRVVAEGPLSALLARAGTSELELGLAEPAQRGLVASLEGVELLGEAGGRLHLRLRDLDVPELLERLLARGVRVNALVPRGRRLEDLYLSRTGGAG